MKWQKTSRILWLGNMNHQENWIPKITITSWLHDAIYIISSIDVAKSSMFEPSFPSEKFAPRSKPTSPDGVGSIRLCLVHIKRSTVLYAVLFKSMPRQVLSPPVRSCQTCSIEVDSTVMGQPQGVDLSRRSSFSSSTSSPQEGRP